MLTSFFGKSNPLNFLILGIFIFFGYTAAVLKADELEMSIETILTQLALVSICIFAMLLVDFIIRKNALTKSNTYGILLFSSFLMMIPGIYSKTNLLLANIFLLLALRRILSLRSGLHNEKKILDAAFWISLASFFYFHSLLFLIVLYIAIFKSKHTNYKHLLIPVLGFLAVFILFTTYNFLLYDSFDWFYNWSPSVSIDFSIYKGQDLVVPASVLFTFVLLFGGARLLRFATIPKKEKPNKFLMFIVALITLSIVIISPQKTGMEFLFMATPIAIISSNFIENNAKVWINEVTLWLMVLVPIFLWIA